MKKILSLLLLSVSIYGQVSTGQEQEFDYGIKNNSTQTVTSADYVTTTGNDGTQGKILPSDLPTNADTQSKIDILNQNANTGILSGGNLSINATPTLFNIASGKGYIVNSLTSTITTVTWATQSGLTTPFRTTNIATYVLIDNSGAIVLQPTAPTNQQYRTHIYIGKLAHTTFTDILFAITEPSRMFNVSGDLQDLSTAIGSINISGNIITSNGANLNINVSSGSSLRWGANYVIDRNSPNVTTENSGVAIQFRQKFRNGSGGWNAVNTTTIDPNKYDDGSGILATVPNNKWTVKKFWRFGGTGTVHVDMGQAFYNTKSEAIESISKAITSEDPDNVRDASRRGWLVLKQGITVLNDVNNAEFFVAGKFGERLTSSGTTTLQGAYNNSVTPHITTSVSGGALAIKRGTTSDLDDVLVVQNGAGTTSFNISANGLTGLTGTASGLLFNTNSSYTGGSTPILVNKNGLFTIYGSSSSNPSTHGGISFDGVNITGATDRIFTFPNISGTIALTSNITGTTNFIPKFTGSSTLGNSLIYDDGGNVGIGTSSPNSNTNRTTLTLNNNTWGGQLDINVGGVNHAQFGTDNFNSGLSCRIQSQDGIVFNTAGSFEKMRITSSGNVLMGTTADDGVNKLQVNGNTRISGLSGTGTRIVTADASGNLGAITDNFVRLTGVSNQTINSDVIIDGTLQTTATLTAANIVSEGVVRLKGYTVATLPAGTVGDMAYVTDATGFSYNSIIVGGGSSVVPVFFDGTNWRAH